MPTTFTITSSETRAPSADDLEIAGEDISLERGDFSETANGDIATVRGASCARQSVVREALANPGSFPRRQDWGGGLSAMLFKNNTTNSRDRAASRVKARVQVNPRIVKIHEIYVESIDNDGIRLHVRADSVGGPVQSSTVIKPPGVR